MGVAYRCERCTACCCWPGEVRVTNAEISRLAAFLAIPASRFVQEHTRLNAEGNALVLAEQPNGHCVFLEGRDCRVQAVKPDQCREFPDRGQFPGFERLCRAIPEEIDGPVAGGGARSERLEPIVSFRG